MPSSLIPWRLKGRGLPTEPHKASIGYCIWQRHRRLLTRASAVRIRSAAGVNLRDLAAKPTAAVLVARQVRESERKRLSDQSGRGQVLISLIHADVP